MISYIYKRDRYVRGTYLPFRTLFKSYIRVRTGAGGAARAAQTRGHACSRRATRVRECFLYARCSARVRALLHSTQCDILVILLAKYHARRNKFAADVI